MLCYVQDWKWLCFLMLMNHPPPMTEKNYRKIGYTYHDAVKQVADEIMIEAVNELRS